MSFYYNLLKDKFPQNSLIFDPCSGQGSLLIPWKKQGYRTYGNEIDSHFLQQGLADGDTDFINNWTSPYALTPNLILCNPPFNGNKSKLTPEIWMDKIIELFGKDIPLVLFVPIGFRLNSTLTSKRYRKFVAGIYPKITSQIALTRDIYNLEPQNRPTEFHSEILIFNIHGLQPHYFFTSNYE